MAQPPPFGILTLGIWFKGDPMRAASALGES
jgi:hypothetical protein